MVNNDISKHQELNTIFNKSKGYINQIKQKSHSLDKPLSHFKRNKCDCKSAGINITNNTCYCNVAKNHRRHNRNIKGKKSFTKRIINFFKRSNNYALGKKGKKSKKVNLNNLISYNSGRYIHTF